MHNYKKHYFFVLFLSLSNNASASWQDSLNRQLHDLQNDWSNWWYGRSNQAEPAHQNTARNTSRAERESIPTNAMTETQIKNAIDSHFRQVFNNTPFANRWHNDADELYHSIITGNSGRISQNHYNSDYVNQLIRGHIFQCSSIYVEHYAFNAFDVKAYVMGHNAYSSPTKSDLAQRVAQSTSDNMRVEIEQGNLSHASLWIRAERLNNAIDEITFRHTQQQHNSAFARNEARYQSGKN